MLRLTCLKSLSEWNWPDASHTLKGLMGKHGFFVAMAPETYKVRFHLLMGKAWKGANSAN
jgi:hypothetical protein